MNNIENVLTTLLEYLQSAISFTIEQAPILVKELLAYEQYRLLYTGISCVVMTIFFVVLAIFSFKKSKKITKERGDDWMNDIDVLFFIIAVVSSITALVFLLVFALYVIPNSIKLQVAPRLYLLEYAKSLLKK